MCKIMEEMRNEAVFNERSRLVLKMLKRGDSLESIADFFEITVEEVRNLIAQKSA